MHRREFLASASAFVVALKLLPSTPALAAEPPADLSAIPYDELVRIEDAFRILEDLKFGSAAQARQFGLTTDYFETTTSLRDAAHARVSTPEDLWKRVRYIELIHLKLNASLGPDIEEHLRWLNTAPMSWGFGFTFRDSLENGTLSELRFAAYNMTGEPCRTNNPLEI
ncbi:MAG TPA: hypothetical protein VMU25_03805 [Candidatus Paceibacterota bacterium]|nr:hypothetical protein [Candidatus Paceibacterota bacterium]